MSKESKVSKVFYFIVFYIVCSFVVGILCSLLSGGGEGTSHSQNSEGGSPNLAGYQRWVDLHNGKHGTNSVASTRSGAKNPARFAGPVSGVKRLGKARGPAVIATLIAAVVQAKMANDKVEKAVEEAESEAERIERDLYGEDPLVERLERFERRYSEKREAKGVTK